jgi:phospholipase C
MGFDEHPPADVAVRMKFQQELITALRASRAWESSAFLLTYDEHGGFFAHVAPPQVDGTGSASACRSRSYRPSPAAASARPGGRPTTRRSSS